jgi:hypothetical protein
MPKGPGTYGSQRGRPPKKKSGLKYQADKTLLDLSEKMYEAQKKRATMPIDIDLQSFQLKSGNKPPFEQMGSSPVKQAIGGGPGEAIEHWKKYQKAKKPGTISAVSKEITRVAKGGKPKVELIKEAAKKTTTKAVKKTTTKAAKIAAKKSFDKWMLGIIKKGGTRAMGTVGAYFGSMKAATATQPGTGKHGGKKTGKYNPKTGKYE